LPIERQQQASADHAERDERSPLRSKPSINSDQTNDDSDERGEHGHARKCCNQGGVAGLGRLTSSFAQLNCQSMSARTAPSNGARSVPVVDEGSIAIACNYDGIVALEIQRTVGYAAGRMSARPVSVSLTLRRCAGLSVTMTSRVGRTCPSPRCPALALPSRWVFGQALRYGG
jgi:hypothetical protein